MPKERVLVIRQDDRFSSLLREAGFEVINLELIRTEPLEDLKDLDAGIARLKGYDGLFFTSPKAASVFAERFEKAESSFAGKTYVLGGRAKQILERAGFTVVDVPAANTAGEMIRSFDGSEFAGKRFLFVRGEQSMRTIPDLIGLVATVDEAVVYRTIEVPPDQAFAEAVRRRLNAGEIDWICFFSPSGVESFARVFGGEARSAPAAAIGETTARSAQDAGMNVRYISPRSNAEDFAKGLIESQRNPSDKLKTER